MVGVSGFFIKMKKEDIIKIINFLSDNDITLSSTGNYDFPKEISIEAIYEFISTGKSELIKKHQNWTWGCWRLNEYIKGSLYSNGELDYWIRLRELKNFWKDIDDIDKLDELIKKLTKREEILKTYKYKRRNSFTPLLKKQCLDRDNKKCVICLSDKNLEVDHKIELIDGGDNVLENLQVLCSKCHREKTNRSIKKRKNI